ncbi:MAG: DMT family transporter [Propylenella sp.]
MSNTSAVRSQLEPVLLLLVTGFFIGLIFPLGRLAGEASIPPLLFAGASAAGGSVVLAAITLLFGAAFSLDRASLFYAAVVGQLTFAIPFGLLIFVIPHIGSGIPAILQSLTPIFTLAIVAMIGLERPRPLRIFGVAIGVAGAAIILFSRNAGELQAGAPFGWYLAALVTPITLSAGNVYRTVGWPAGRSPLVLATLTLAAAAIALLLMLLVARALGAAIEIATPLAAGWRLILMQSLATGFGYAFFFRLQQVGGPLYLSQISYVNTAVGVAFALLLFAEQLSAVIWVAMVFVFAGVALVNRTQARQ